jgi:hypothetical protein
MVMLAMIGIGSRQLADARLGLVSWGKHVL